MMNKSLIMGLGILSVVLIIVSISGCGNNNSHIYNSSKFSFKIPSGWSQTGDKNDYFVLFTKGKQNNNGKYNASMQVTTQSAENFNGLSWLVSDFINESQRNNITIITQESRKIAGVDGYRIDIQDNYGKNSSYTIFIKENLLYTIQFGPSDGNIASINDDIETVLNSFQTWN